MSELISRSSGAASGISSVARPAWRAAFPALIAAMLLAGTGLPALAEQQAGQLYAIEVPVEKIASTLLLDVASAGSRLVAVGQRGHIIYSDDQGKTWVQAKVPSRVLLTAVFFADDSHAAQRQRRGLPALHVVAGWRPLLRKVPRGRTQSRYH